MKFWERLFGESKEYLPIIYEHVSVMRNEIASLRAELASLRLDVNAMRIAQAKIQHRQAAEGPVIDRDRVDTIRGQTFGLTEEQSKMVDWNRVR